MARADARSDRKSARGCRADGDSEIPIAAVGGEPVVPETRSLSLVARLREASLTVKLATLAALVTSVVLIATFMALSVRTRQTAQEVFADQLASYQRTLGRLQQQNLNQLVSS